MAIVTAIAISGCASDTAPDQAPYTANVTGTVSPEPNITLKDLPKPDKAGAWVLYGKITINGEKPPGYVKGAREVLPDGTVSGSIGHVNIYTQFSEFRGSPALMSMFGSIDQDGNYSVSGVYPGKLKFWGVLLYGGPDNPQRGNMDPMFLLDQESLSFNLINNVTRCDLDIRTPTGNMTADGRPMPDHDPWELNRIIYPMIEYPGATCSAHFYE